MDGDKWDTIKNDNKNKQHKQIDIKNEDLSEHFIGKIVRKVKKKVIEEFSGRIIEDLIIVKGIKIKRWEG